MADYENDSLEAREPEYEYAYDRKDCVGDECYFGIGSTTPPKDHTAVVAVVLILLISICGVLSILGLMDIDPLKRMNQMEPSEPDVGVPVSFSPSNQALPDSLEEIETVPTVPLESVPQSGDAYGNMELHISTQPTVPPLDPAAETLPGQDIQKTVEPLSWQQVYKKVIPSVVSVVCTGSYSASSGTGVIMDDAGYIITNAHVVEDAAEISVLLHDGRTVSAQCLGLDIISDLAVLYVEAEGLIAAEFGDSELLEVGDEVVAIGDPLGVELRGTMTDGMISAINRDLQINGRTMSLIQTSAALNSGNSGGPLVNCYGQVIGINTMKIGDYASSGGVEGIGFAIPMTSVKGVVEQLATIGYVAGRPDLGLEGQMVSQFYQHYYRLPAGMIITWVDAGSDAAALGVREGDILLYLDGQRITDLAAYQEVVNGLEVDQQVSAMIYRSGKEYELTLTVGENKG